MMRTTLKIDDDVLQAAGKKATAEGKSIGKALSELVRRGIALGKQSKSRFPVFDVPPDAAPITLDMVRAAMGEE